MAEKRKEKSVDDEFLGGVRWAVALVNSADLGARIFLLPLEKYKSRKTGVLRRAAGYPTRASATARTKRTAPPDGYRFAIVSLTDAEVARSKRLDDLRKARRETIAT